MKILARAFLIAAAFTTAACADSIQPIVTPGQALYGSAQKTITSSSDVLISTSTHAITAMRGITTSSITFNDGTIITSSSTLGGAPVWGTIIGTLRNQIDLQTQLTAIGVSTAALSASTTTLGASVTSLNGTVAALSVSTASLQTQVNALNTSTTTLQTNIDAVTGVLGDVIISTGQLEAQINNLTPVSLSTGVTGILQPSHMVSTAAFTTANQNFSGTQTFSSPSGTTFTYGVTAGSITDNDLQISSFVVVDAAKHLTSFDLYGNSLNTWTGTQNFTGSAGVFVNYGVQAGSITLTSLPGTGPLRGGPSIAVSTGPTNLTSEVSGILPVVNGGSGSASPSLIGGSNVTVTGSWPNQTINSTSGGAANIAIATGTTSGFSYVSSSPTAAVNFDGTVFISALKGGATSFVSLNSSSVTLQGNTFNSANQLVKLSAGSQLPAADGNLLTNLNGAQVTGTVPAAALTNAVLNQNTLQAGTTFFVSSGTAQSFNTNSITFGDGSTQTSAANAGVTGLVAGAGITISAPTGNVLISAPGASTSTIILNQNTLQAGATFYVSSGTVAGQFHTSEIMMDANGAGVINFANLTHNGNSTIQNQGSSGQSAMTVAATNGMGVNIAPVDGQDLTAPYIVATASAAIGGIINATYKGALSIVHNPTLVGYEITAASNTTSAADFTENGGFLSLGTPNANGSADIALFVSGHETDITNNGAFSPYFMFESASGAAFNNGSGTAEPIYARQSAIGSTLGNIELGTFPGFDSGGNIDVMVEHGVQIGTATLSGANSEVQILAPTTQKYEIAAGTANVTTSAPFNFTVSTSGVITAKQIATSTFKAPTVQKFTSGSGTYTLPTNPSPLYINVIMVAGGGGGSGSGTTGQSAGVMASSSTFGTSLLNTQGGFGGSTNANGGGAGGSASLGSGPIGTALSGGGGVGSIYIAASAIQLPGSAGGANPLGGAGLTATTGGVAGIPNTGSGGGGGGTSAGTALLYTGAGGGAGGYINALISSPLSTYAYSVGAGGAAGGAGTSGQSGVAGSSGYIEVREFYQ